MTAARTAPLNLAPFVLVIDSREQRPYSFDGVARTVRAALPAGDYSIVGSETSFAIERTRTTARANRQSSSSRAR